MVTIESGHLSRAIFEVTTVKLVILVFSVTCHFLPPPPPRPPFFILPLSVLIARVNVGDFPFPEASKTVFPNRFDSHFRAAEFSGTLEQRA